MRLKIILIILSLKNLLIIRKKNLKPNDKKHKKLNIKIRKKIIYICNFSILINILSLIKNLLILLK